jgi:hypothetical protein
MIDVTETRAKRAGPVVELVVKEPVRLDPAREEYQSCDGESDPQKQKLGRARFPIHGRCLPRASEF